MAVLEALLTDAYATVAPAEAVLDALDTAGVKLEQSMPRLETWGTSDHARRAAAKAEAMFGPT